MNYQFFKLGKRSIYTPSDNRSIEKIADVKNELYQRFEKEFSNSVCGFIRDRNIIDAINPHMKHYYWYRIDIKHFYETISEDLLYRQLVKKYYPDEAKEIISVLMIDPEVDYIFLRDGRKFQSILNTLNKTYTIDMVPNRKFLPLGPSSSPVASNIAMLDIDHEIEKSLSELKIEYTRYADDIIISCGDIDNPEPDSLTKLDDGLAVVTDILNRNGFQINQDKLRKLTKWPRRILGVWAHHPSTGKKFTVGKKYRDDVKLLAHHLATDVYNQEMFNVLVGKLAFMIMIGETEWSHSFYEQVYKAFRKHARNHSLLDRITVKPKKI